MAWGERPGDDGLADLRGINQAPYGTESEE
jgi:hypothetical protein